MGDRGNIKVVEEGAPDLFMYTHWCGSELEIIVRQGLDKGRSLWDDASYLNRVLFCTLVENGNDDVTGFGLSTIMGDGDDRVVTVNHSDKTVTDLSGRTQSFDDFTFDDFTEEEK